MLLNLTWMHEEKNLGKNVCKSLLKHENMTKLMFFGGSGIASSVAVTRTTQNYRKRLRTILKLGTLIEYGATNHGSNSQAGETNSDHSVQQTRIIKTKFLSYFRENWLQPLLKPILYGLESIDGWFKTNYGLIWHDKTTRNVDEHFHYTLATTLGNYANMYRILGPYQLHVNREAVRVFVSFL